MIFKYIPLLIILIFRFFDGGKYILISKNIIFASLVLFCSFLYSFYKCHTITLWFSEDADLDFLFVCLNLLIFLVLFLFSQGSIFLFILDQSFPRPPKCLVVLISIYERIPALLHIGRRYGVLCNFFVSFHLWTPHT